MKQPPENKDSRPSPGVSVAVIGAGIVGVCCAAELVERGYRVTLLDRGEPGREGASRANAGQIIPSLIQPVSYPGIWRDVPRLLLDRDSPLTIAPAHLLRVVPWLIRFLAAGTRRRHEAGVASLAQLNAEALEATRSLYQRAGLASLLQNTGALYLHETPQSLDRAKSVWAIKGRHGYHHEFLDSDALRMLEPDLGDGFAGAVLEKGVWHVSDPLKIVEGIARYAVERGTRFLRQEARIEALSSDGVRLAIGGGRVECFDRVVIAAGAWSRRLLRDIGDDAPLEAERGYNITIPEPGVNIRHCLVFSDRGFVATPLVPGLRIGGCVELAGIAAPPDPRRIQGIVKIATRLIPALRTEGGRTWMGPRPALPDSVPVIARSPMDPRVVYAFGHGHLGLTQGPVTGRRVAALISQA